MDGYEVCRRLKADANTQEIPVIFLTAKTQVEDESQGFEVGCVDYITKPISPPIVLARVRTHLALKAAADFLRDKNAYLAAEVARRTKQISVVQDVTIMAMASLAETRDNETGNHIRRTQHYVRLLALELRKQPKFAAVLDDATIELLFKSAPLHDIGKVGIPDAILLKPGKLTPDEFEGHEDAHHARAGRHRCGRGTAGRAGLVPGIRARDRIFPPGEVGRDGLPGGARGGANSAVGPAHGGRRRLRRADLAARLQAPVSA
jgi:response regulator RpfG family c-di-GMP phosphodiesterase